MIADEIIDEFRKYGDLGFDGKGEIDVYEKRFFGILLERNALACCKIGEKWYLFVFLAA